VPFILSNGTTADATQVMANYNALIACLTNAAAAGANVDITSLTGLTTPLAPSAGGTTSYVGSTSSGTNAIVVASTTPSVFALTAGNKVSFVAGGGNGVGATTLNVNGSGVKNILRVDPTVGLTALAGGEIIGGQFVEVIYDGTQYQLRSYTKPIGEVFDFAGSACPIGSQETTGGTVVAATFPGLNTVLGTIWGTSAGNVVVPDLRGRATFSRDIGGSGRITVAGGNFDGTVVGNVGGAQSALISQAQLPSVNFTNSGITLTNGVPAFSVVGGAGGQGFAGVQGTLSSPTGSLTGIASTIVTNVSVNSQGSAASGGSAAIRSELSPAAIVIKCVKL
jgi:hypothetical protein